MGILILLSPAKTLDFTPADTIVHTQPKLLDQSEELVRVLRQKKQGDLKKLMKISDKLAELNVQRYQHFSTPFTPDNAKPSLLTFKGDVYTGMQADTFSADELQYAQQHIRILSGLYGVLRPLDLMQPYRLEMGTKLTTNRGKNLYEFWENRITETINQDVEENNLHTILNLASKEYFSSVKPAGLSQQLVQVDFKEERNGVLKVISFTAKKARGNLARQIVKNRLDNVEALKARNVEGYLFSDRLSAPDYLVFTK